MIAQAAFSYREFSSIDHASEEFSSTQLPATLAILDVQQALKENFGFSQTLHVAADPVAVEKAILANIAKIDRRLTEYPNYIRNDEARRQFEEFAALRAAWVNSFKELMRLQKAGLKDEASAWVGTYVLPAYEAANRALTEITDQNVDGLTVTNQAIRDDVQLGTHALIVGIVSALLGSLVLAFFLCRAIAKILQTAAHALTEGANEATAAAGQVAAASQNLASGASQQAAALEETSASAEELGSTIHQNAERGSVAKSLAIAAGQATRESMTKATHLNTAMAEMRASNSEIGKIVKTIDEIAFQTNLLALNAAIEAARAGFSVVADEVRALAHRSATAAQETSEKIQTALARSDEEIRVASDIVKGLTEIDGRVHELEKIVVEISVSASEQAQGISQINSAMSQIDHVTQSNAAAAEQAASAAEELAAQAIQVNAIVRQISLLAGAANASSATTDESQEKSPPSPTPQSRQKAGATMQEAAVSTA